MQCPWKGSAKEFYQANASCVNQVSGLTTSFGRQDYLWQIAEPLPYVSLEGLNQFEWIQLERSTWFGQKAKSVHRIVVTSTLHQTICPTWFIINLDSCCTESFVPVDCKQSYWWFGRPHSSTRAIIHHIREGNHVIKYFVSENINILILHCLKEKEIGTLLDKL